MCKQSTSRIYPPRARLFTASQIKRNAVKRARSKARAELNRQKRYAKQRVERNSLRDANNVLSLSKQNTGSKCAGEKIDHVDICKKIEV